MALFNRESKEDKQAEKLQAFLNKYDLNGIQDPATLEVIRSIANTMNANRFTEVGSALQGNGQELAKQTYLKALVEQNFIIIRQLDQLIKR